MFKRFYRYILPFWRMEALALLLGAASAGMGLLTPYLTKLVIDKAYLAKDLRLFIILVGTLGAVFLLGTLFQGLGNYFIRYVKLRVSLQLNRSLFKKFQSLPYGAFQESSTGEILYKINHDIDQVTQLIADLVPQIIILIPRSLFILSLILFIDPKMFLFVLVLVPFTYIGPYYFTTVLRRAWKEVVDGSQGIFKKLQESISHMYLIKVYGKERRETRSYVGAVIRNIRLRLKNEKIGTAASFLNALIQKAVLGVIIFYGGYQVIKGHMTLGSLSAISIYLGQLSSIQWTFANFVQQGSLGLVSCERLEKVLDMKMDLSESPGAKSMEFHNGKLEFDHVTFSYRADRKVIEGLSFSVEGGSCVALAGPSGSGKTTLINLLLRLYQPLGGRVVIDGEDLRYIEARSLYRQTGVVFQEPYLWNDTVEKNIRYGIENASLKEIEEAARIACIDGFIGGLPEKYETVIGENACKISEGQKQRIAIARAVLKRPKILILDEAFSSLDSELEDKIMSNLRAALSGSTLILISHRLSTIQKADLVYFLEDAGKIDRGSHHEVFQRSSQYRDYLAAHQAT